MIGALLTLVSGFVFHYIENQTLDFQFIQLLMVVNFLFLFVRFFVGDIHYNLICSDIGLNDKHTSGLWILRNKPFIDTLFLFLQSLLFVILALLLTNQILYFICYSSIILINCIWLLIQHLCWCRYSRCVLSKAERKVRGYTKCIVVKKIKEKNIISNVILTWLFNNLMFLFSAVFIITFYFYDNTILIYFGMISAAINSILDFIFTFSIYSRPKMVFSSY